MHPPDPTPPKKTHCLLYNNNITLHQRCIMQPCDVYPLHNLVQLQRRREEGRLIVHTEEEVQSVVLLQLCEELKLR